MKSKYDKIIWNMYENMRQIPLAISGLGGATAFANSYISAYKDIEPAWQYISIILDGLKNVDIYENIIKTDENCDKKEMKGQIEFYLNAVNKATKDFDNFVKERKAQNWR